MALITTGTICLQLMQMSPPSLLSDLFCCREKELAKKYYDKLFKEYCIADLSKFKENKVRNGTCKNVKCNGKTAKMEIK